VVKRDRQLHHTLKMPSQRRVSRYGAPEVFENFVGVEKVRVVEKLDSFLKIRIVESHFQVHRDLDSLLEMAIYIFP